jgi:murein DD-endopeptidase MepM/ murein hydrolase activator NlpD
VVCNLNPPTDGVRKTMDKKAFTFLIVSNTRGKTWRFTVSSTWLKVGLSLAAIVVLIGSATIVDYLGLLIQSAENKRLKAENLELARQFQVVEGKVNALETSLERVKTFSKKLRLITNVDDEDRGLKLSMGVNNKPGQPVDNLDEPVDSRGPASAWAEQDAMFVKKTTVDEQKGEITAPGSRDYASLSIRIDQAVKDTQLREQGILELWETLSEKQSLLNATPNIKPVRGWYTSRFGYRISPFNGRLAMHNGLDVAAAPGTPIVAPADGVVSFAGYDSTYGKLVSIDHGYGVITRFGHNSQIFVRVGQKIRRRDVIAAVGNTGRSTGTHLHYEVRVNNVPVDPTNYILE